MEYSLAKAIYGWWAVLLCYFIQRFSFILVLSPIVDDVTASSWLSVICKMV
ncbi:hypothetical protein ABQG65_04935 [Yersinia alsatica]|uniref:hypothetical protein n=1 Tax=Yersinia alsatica TaxID=2890317 RepID=UPI0032EB6965